MKTDMNRRDVLKALGVAGTVLMGSAPAAAETAVRLPSSLSRKKARIVIVGGGAGGMATTARIRRAAPNADVTLIAQNRIHLYEPGQVFVAAGLYEQEDIERLTSKLLPDNVTWLQEELTEIDPHNNSVTTDKRKLRYDYLIVALDAEYDYERIDGLDSSMVGQDGIASVYLNDTSKGIERGGEITGRWFEEIYQSASDGSVSVLFTEPDTLVKEMGASLSVLFLGNDILKGNGPSERPDVNANAQYHFVRPDEMVFDAGNYDSALHELVDEAGNTEMHFDQVLTAIDGSKKRALFKSGNSTIEMPYDFIHITPPMKPPEVLKNSALAVRDGRYKGWMEVDHHTLLHPKFPNVFGIGNALAMRNGKTTDSTRTQAIVIQDNLPPLMEGKDLPASYDGHTVARIKTRYGEELLAEFNDQGMVSHYGLDPYKPHWIWWAIDRYLMPRLYFELMMRGMY